MLELRPGAAAAPDLILQHHGCLPGASTQMAADCRVTEARDVLACFRRWQEAQQPLLAVLAGVQLGGSGVVAAAAAGEVAQGGGTAGEAQQEVHLDFSRQGLASLHLLASCTSLRSLDLGGNALSRWGRGLGGGGFGE